MRSFEIEQYRQTALITLAERVDEPGLTRADLDELPIAIREAARNPDARFLVFAGRGGVFCRGGSAKEITLTTAAHVEERSAHVERVQAIVWAALCSPLMTVAAVYGLAVGPGADLAVACDRTFVGEGTRFTMWYNRLGLVPDMGFFLFADAFGYKAALRAYAEASVWSADELVARSMAERLDTPPEGAAGWQAFLSRRYRHLPDTYAAAKRMRIAALEESWQREMKLICGEQAHLLGRPDMQERLQRTAALQSMSSYGVGKR